MAVKRIFIIDDDTSNLEFLSYNLEKEGFKTECYSNPLLGLQAIIFGQPDLVITDWIMSDLDGLELCRRIKRNPRSYKIPLVMITCKNEMYDMNTALKAGVDEFIVKPFKLKDLITKVRKLLNFNDIINIDNQDGYVQKKNNQPREIHIKGLVIDKSGHEVLLDDMKIELTFSEFKLLELLAEKPGKVFTRNQILQFRFGQDYFATERTVDVKIVALRKKLGKYKSIIKTIRSVGYKLDHEKIPLKTIVE